MNAALIDSSVLLDILSPDSEWLEWSSTALAKVADQCELIINPIIYSEVSTRYATIEEVDAALPGDMFHRENIPYSAAFLAAKAFMKYRRHGRSRTAPIADFYIGAHAAVARYKILTRDPRRFRRYFPTVELIAP